MDIVPYGHRMDLVDAISKLKSQTSNEINPDSPLLKEQIAKGSFGSVWF